MRSTVGWNGKVDLQCFSGTLCLNSANSLLIDSRLYTKMKI